MHDQRALPSRLESERAILGAMLQWPELLPDVESVIKPGDFWKPEHGALFGLMLERYRQRLPVDLIAVPEAIMAGGEVHRYGGVAYVVELADAVSTSANVVQYAEAVRDVAILREMIGVFDTARGRALSSHDPDEVIDEVAQMICNVRRPRKDEPVLLGDGIWEAVDRKGHEAVNPELVRITRTRFLDLDRVLRMRPGQLMILAARPAMGKSALAQNIALNVATAVEEGRIVPGRPVLFLSCEMSKPEIIDRALAIATAIPHDHIIEPRLLGSGDWEVLREAREEFRYIPLLLDHCPGLTPAQARSKALAAQARFGELALVVVDYIGLMPTKLGHRTEQTGANGQALKDLAGEMDCPVLALHQLNRRVEDRPGGIPLLSDLKDSGDLEQHADTVLFLVRPKVYDRARGENEALVIVAKQRGGSTGWVPMEWWGAIQTFRDRRAQEDQTRPTGLTTSGLALEAARHNNGERTDDNADELDDRRGGSRATGTRDSEGGSGGRGQLDLVPGSGGGPDGDGGHGQG